MFAYNVMSEQEAMSERFQLLKEGIYDAVVTVSVDTNSSKGHPMMDITLAVYDENGKTHDVRDFLVFTKQMMWKVIHFADSAGIVKEYEEGKLCSENAINKLVKVKIAIEQGKEIPIDKLNGKPLGTKYFDKNKVEDYIKKCDQVAPNSENKHFMDDEVPFI
jgi:hypothetical protein